MNININIVTDIETKNFQYQKLMKNSCGALFYAYDDEGHLGIILGEEGKEEWLPFKGCAEENESFECAAIREIREETCGLVVITDIVLEHRFSTKRKNYYIGLCQVPYTIIDEFKKIVVDETRKEFKEKRELKFFPLGDVLKVPTVHSISRASIQYYWNRLHYLANNPPSENERMRCHGITFVYAEKIKQLMAKESEKTDNSSTYTEIYTTQMIPTYEDSILSDLQNTQITPDSQTNSSVIRDEIIRSFDDKVGKIEKTRSLNKDEKSQSFSNSYRYGIDKDKYMNKKKNTNRYQTTSNVSRYNMKFTPNMDRFIQNNRTWRRDTTVAN